VCEPETKQLQGGDHIGSPFTGRDGSAMLEDFQATDTRGLTSAEVTYSFAETAAHISSRPRRNQRVPSQLFRYRVVKRGLDILAVVAAVPVLVPIFLMLGFLVVLSSPGPVFYAHRRIRHNGAFFSMWKFRTMCVNSAEVLEDYLSMHPDARVEWNTTHKLRHDPRVTPVGLILRRYSMDELPQVWNVLTGKMSLVGPRPIVAAEVEKYKDSFSFYCRVKPGLTGLWQVSGRSKLTYDERVALDRDYVEHWSLRRDLMILAKTIPSVVNQDGAY
jgi:lipopolysaccharide/colanic/teichoic acid biosynthesis glycosyltransferase